MSVPHRHAKCAACGAPFDCASSFVAAECSVKVCRSCDPSTTTAGLRGVELVREWCRLGTEFRTSAAGTQADLFLGEQRMVLCEYGKQWALVSENELDAMAAQHQRVIRFEDGGTGEWITGAPPDSEGTR